MTEDQALFERAMNLECKRCGKPASQHRLTPAGNLYCLEYNAYNLYELKVDRSYQRTGTYTCPVNKLERSTFSKKLGQLLNANLREYLEVTA